MDAAVEGPLSNPSGLLTVLEPVASGAGRGVNLGTSQSLVLLLARALGSPP